MDLAPSYVAPSAESAERTDKSKLMGRTCFRGARPRLQSEPARTAVKAGSVTGEGGVVGGAPLYLSKRVIGWGTVPYVEGRCFDKRGHPVYSDSVNAGRRLVQPAPAAGN